MFKRGLVLCLMLAVASVAQAGAVVDLVSSAPAIPAGGSVTVSVYITQDTGATMLPRMVQLDSSASTSGLAFSAPGTSGTIVEMWDFDSATDCPGTCGTAHVIDAAFPVVSAAYGDATHLLPNAAVQMNLPDSVQTKIGEFVVECGTAAAGPVTVDVLNAAGIGADDGARLFFGFGANIDGTPITTWTAANVDITGSSIELDGSACGAPLVNLAASDPACEDSLVRPANNCIFLTFDGAISAPAPGDIEIVPLLPGGAFGADMSASFIMTVEPGDVLKIVEDGDIFSISTWYAVRNAGWSGVDGFQVDYLVLYGDVDNDRTVGGLDAGQIWGARGPAIDECDRLDLDSDGTVGGLDAGQAWGGRGVAFPDKPDGHGCLP